MASDFSASWALCRQRFCESVADLDQAQLNFRLHNDALTIGEAAIHVAGVELYFMAQLLDETLDGDLARIAASAVQGVVNNEPFPFSKEEITPTLVQDALEIALSKVKPFVENPPANLLSKEIKSALGPIIDGRGALARFGFHAGYHQGQVYLIRSAPGFPGSVSKVH